MSDHPRTIAFLPWGDRFEDFHDRIGVSLDDLRDRLMGTWLFNTVEALRIADVDPVLFFVSARVDEPTRFVNAPTGARVRVVPAPRMHRKLQALRDRLGQDTATFSSLRSYVATPWRAVVAEMRRDGCQAIMSQEYEAPRFDEAVAVGRIVGVPVFATFQGAAPRSTIERPARRAAVARAAGVVAGSAAELSRVRAAYGLDDDRLALIPNPLDVDRWRPGDRADARAALGVSPDAQVAVWHGRIEIESKGLDVLLEAWRCLWGSPARRLLLVVGAGQDEREFARLVASMPDGSVRWERRWVFEPEEVRRYLAAGDVAARASRREGFAVSLVEAMACGLPVVSTDVSGVPEAFGKEGDGGPAGIAVPPDDPSALAAEIEALFDDADRRAELGARARRRAETAFSLDAVGRRLRDFMESRGAFRSPRP